MCAPSKTLQFEFEIGSPNNPVDLPLSDEDAFQLIKAQIDEHLPDLRKHFKLGISSGKFTICNDTITVKWKSPTLIIH